MRGDDPEGARKARSRSARPIRERAFRRELERADGVLTDAIRRRGTSRHYYLRALRTGGVTADRQGQVIEEVRRDLCVGHFAKIGRKDGAPPSSYQIQTDHPWLWQRIRRHFGSWGAFLEHVAQPHKPDPAGRPTG